MLTITVVLDKGYDEATKEFIETTFDLELEHSLVSLSKWESKFKKAFLGKAEKTPEEVLAYVECMTLTPVFSPEVFLKMSKENFDAINAYVGDPMTATHLRENPNQQASAEVVTSELIYYWMISLNIPDRFETWHLNRLLTLIRVCNAKNSPSKKMSPQELAQRNRDLNEQRRAQMGTRG